MIQPQFILNQQVVIKQTSNLWCVMKIGSTEMWELNQSAGILLNLFRRPLTIDQAIEQLEAQYIVSNDLHTQLHSFLDVMREENILVKV